MANHKPAIAVTLAQVHQSISQRLCWALLLCLIVSCSDNKESASQTASEETGSESSAAALSNILPADVIATLGALILENKSQEFQFAARDVQQFQTSAAEFLASPSAESLTMARQAWLIAHSRYEATALARYLLRASEFNQPAPGNGPDTFLDIEAFEYQIDPWPILPGYIDYLENYPQSGIVNDSTIALSEEVIRDQHGRFTILEASLGFHVIEFLLWGDVNKPGEMRSHSDYLNDSGNESISQQSVQSSPQRRRILLQLLIQLLVEDIASLNRFWQSNLPKLTTYFDSVSGQQGVSTLLNATAALVSDEILVQSLYPLLNGNFDEGLQSPFSATTQNAAVAQLSGVESLLRTSTTDLGVNLESLLSELDINFGQTFFQNFDASKECLARLYTSVQQTQETTVSIQQEVEIVSCINLATNMINGIDLAREKLKSGQ